MIWGVKVIFEKVIACAMSHTHIPPAKSQWATYPYPLKPTPPGITPGDPLRGSYVSEIHRQIVPNMGKLPKLKPSQAQIAC